jgi:SAM-dependent methyltransferase
VARAEVVDANRGWYHTIDLGSAGITPGHVDWRRYSGRLLGEDLTGLRALDVGTYDGFWAFEMERRGADVVAIDLDALESAEWPPVNRAALERDSQEWGLELGRGFAIARAALGSSVQRVACDVGELTAEMVGGPKDLAFLGALLLHLRDPVRALENVRRTLVPGGRLIMLEAISLTETLLRPRTPLARFDSAQNAFNGWLPNVRTLHHYLWASGFVAQRRIGWPMRPPGRPEMRGWYFAIEARAPSP